MTMSKLEGADIVCFSNDWDGDPLSKTHLMRLAARNNRVLWVNSIGNRAPKATSRDLQRIGRKLMQAFGGLREVEKNIHVLAPLAVPIYDQRWAREVNGHALAAQVRWAMNRLGMKNPITISFLPGAAPAFDRIDAKVRIYYCVDEFSAFEGAGNAIAELERELISKSDLVICSAEKLVQSKRRMHPNVKLVRHGVDLDHFSRTLDPSLKVSELVRDLPKPVFAFMGLVEDWVDLELLGEIAARYKDGTLLIIGRENCDTTALRMHPNVVFLGRRPYSELPSILKGVDIGLVTFRDNELTRAANPLKVREYIAAGLPVVSTPIPEVEKLGICEIARGGDAFIHAIERVLAAGAGPSVERSRTMQSESWESRWEEVSGLIVERMGGRQGPSRRSA
jgi:glycosyltransferase involved in cell wall biosynthesis